jgi:outer membrane protein TolC
MLKKSFLKIFLILIISLFPLICRGEEINKKLYIEDVIKITLKNSLELMSAEQDIIKSNAKVSQANTGNYPSVTGTTTYSRQDPVQTTEFGDNKIAIGQNDQGLAKVTFNYSLYDGSKTTNLVEQATLAKEASYCDIETKKQNIIYKAIENYYSVLRAENLLKVGEHNLTTTQEQYNVSQAFFEEGLVPKADLLKAEAQLSNVQLGLIRAKNNVELTKAALNDTMSLSLETEIEVIDTLKYTEFPADLNYTIETAYKNRKEIRKLELLIEAAEKQIEIAKSEKRPSVYFNFDYIAFSSNFFTPSNSITATLGASFPIFDRGLSKYKVEEAEAGVEQSRIALSQVKQSITLQVKQAYLNLQQSKESVEKIKVNVDAARENYEVARLRYKEGIAPFIEVSDAQFSLTESEINNVHVLYDYYLAKINLVKTTGLLPEDGNIENIKLIK